MHSRMIQLASLGGALAAAACAYTTKAPAPDTAAPAATAPTKTGGPDGSGWEAIDIGDSTVETVRFIDDKRGFMVVSDGPSRGIQYTADGGTTWASREADVSPYGIGFTPALDQIWVVGSGSKSIWTSTDKGQSFAPLPKVPGGWPAAVHLWDKQTILVTDETGDKVYRTADGGATWTPYSFGREVLPGTKGLTVRANDAWIVGGQSFTEDGSGATVAHSADLGQTWTISALKDEAHLHKGGTLHALAPISATELWAAGDNRQLFHTTNGAKTWTQSKGFPEAIRDFGGIVASGKTISLAASSAKGYALFESTDGGATFAITDDRACPNVCDANGVRGMVSPRNGVFFVYGYSGLLWRYTRA